MKKEEISKLTQERLSQMAFDLNQKVIANERERRRLFIENIKVINDDMREGELFKIIVGDEQAKFPAYLAQLEVYYSRAEIDRWNKITKILCNDFGYVLEDLFDIPPTRLEAIANFAKDSKHAEELLGYAKTMTPRDWNDEIRSIRGKPTTDDGHKHKFHDIKICDVCGLKVSSSHEHSKKIQK